MEIMPLHIYYKLFPRATKEQLAATWNKNIQPKAFNRTTIAQLGIHKVKIEHNNKLKICNIFVVPGNRQALLGMPDIEILNILTMNCNTMGTQETNRAAICCTNTANSQGSCCTKHYKNTRQEAGRVESCYTNTSSNSKLKSNSGDKLMVYLQNEIKLFPSWHLPR